MLSLFDAEVHRQDRPLRPSDCVRGIDQEGGGSAHGEQAIGRAFEWRVLPDVKTCDAQSESIGCRS